MTELRNQINNIVQDHQDCLIIAKEINQSEEIGKNFEIAVASSTEPVGPDRKKVWIKRKKNLLKNIVRGSYYDGDSGKFKEYSIFVRTDYIPIEPGQPYVVSHNSSSNFTDVQAHFFDSSYKHVDYNWYAKSTDIIIPDNTSARYMIINFPNANKEDLTEMQIERGTKPTKYEPYIETQKAYIKNNNDVYQEITNDLLIEF